MAQRRHFIDWARGVAVLAMIVWHTADGWLLPAVRSGQGWSLLRFIGGLAAPSFLLLAGAGAALAVRPGEPHRSMAVELARGLEIMLLGYLLRFQTWLLDASAVREPRLVRAWLPLGLGYALLFVSLRKLATSRGQARTLAAAGIASCVIGFVQVPDLAPGRLPRLLQVDVLQAIGASLVLLALAQRLFGIFARPWLAVAIGAAVAAATELVQAFLPGPLPISVAAYLGKFAAAPGAPAPALFPLLPWLSYACFGAAYGSLMRRHSDEVDAIVVRGAIAGATLALVSSESYAVVQRAIAEQPWIVHPLRVAFRVGLVLVLVGVGWLWAEHGRGRALIAYGRASLRIYWAHLMVAYGVLGSPWHKRLYLGEWGARLAVLLLLMWLLTKLGSKARVPQAVQAST